MTEEERYAKLESEKQSALDQSNKTYEDLLNQNKSFSESQNQYLDQYQQQQNDIYDKQTAWQVELQNQNKEKAEKEFQNEAIASKNAYYDFVNPYGVQAELQAQNGLSRSGYSESVKAQAWTTQQNRTAQARASLNDAKLQFDNAIKEAYLSNDTNKAQLALQMLAQRQDEELRNFNYISDVQQNRLTNNQNLNSDYANRYNTLYSQIQDEKATAEAIRQWEAQMAEQQRQYNASLAEQQRQYDANMAWQREQAAREQANWEREYALSKQKASSSSKSSGGSSSGGYSLNENNQSLNDNVINVDYYGFRLSGTKEQVRNSLENNIRNGNISVDAAKKIAEKYGL